MEKQFHYLLIRQVPHLQVKLQNGSNQITLKNLKILKEKITSSTFKMTHFLRILSIRQNFQTNKKYFKMKIKIREKYSKKKSNKAIMTYHFSMIQTHTKNLLTRTNKTKWTQN